MHKLYTILSFILLSAAGYAQAPQAINYQAIARDASGNAVTNTTVSVKFTIEQGVSPGTPVYQEVQNPTTNQFGLFTAKIGQGQVSLGTFTGINWASGNMYLLVEFDATGGTNYTDMGVTQLISVPYALYAETAGNGGGGATGPTGPVGPTGPIGSQGVAGGQGATGP